MRSPQQPARGALSTGHGPRPNVPTRWAWGHVLSASSCHQALLPVVPSHRAGLSLGGAARPHSWKPAAGGWLAGPQGGWLCCRPAGARHSAHPRAWLWAPRLGPPLAQAVGARPLAVGLSLPPASLYPETPVPSAGGWTLTVHELSLSDGLPVPQAGVTDGRVLQALAVPGTQGHLWLEEGSGGAEPMLDTQSSRPAMRPGTGVGPRDFPPHTPAWAGGGILLQGVARGVGGQARRGRAGLGHGELPLDHCGSAPQARRG